MSQRLLRRTVDAMETYVIVRRLKVLVAVGCAVLGAVAVANVGAAGNPGKTVVVYDDFSSRTNAKWSNPYGPGETAIDDADHRETFPNGTEQVRAVPLLTGADFSVYDHLKYMEVSNTAFPVPAEGSLEFSADMTAQTPGTVASLVQEGIFGPSGTWTVPDLPPAAPDYRAPVLQGQQAGVVLNMIDFCTGQLFDWFLAGNTAFTLIERLPTLVTGNTSNPSCPNATYVGRRRCTRRSSTSSLRLPGRTTWRSGIWRGRTRSSTSSTGSSSAG